MTVHYLVEPIKQPLPTLCFQTALLILDQYRRAKSGGITNQPSDLGSIFESGANLKSLGMLTKDGARQFAEQYGFAWQFISTSPDAFDAALRSRGPFAYVGDLPTHRPYQHTLVVTGATKRRDIWTLYYIDPWLGKRDSNEFYNVLRSYLPFDTTSSHNTRIFYPTVLSGHNAEALTGLETPR